MDDHLMPLDPALLGDAELVRRTREGDRIAFGVLYLRHHAAAWRVACVVSGFTDDAEVALLEGFGSVFAALPRDLAGVAFRPYLLACVRQAALGRAGSRERRRRRIRPAGHPPVPGDEVVLSELDHHLVRTALRRLPERWRTALWLAEVEAMTPAEVAAVIGLVPSAVTTLAAGAREEVRQACLQAHRRSEVRAACRFTVDHLETFLQGGLPPRQEALVRAHADGCAACRMRRAELGNVTGSLLAALSPPPLLGGECQRRWLATIPGAGHRPTPPARAADRTRPAVRRIAVPPSLAVAAGVLTAFLGVPRLLPPAPPIRPAGTAMASPIFRASLPTTPLRAPSRATPAPVVELVALTPPPEAAATVPEPPAVAPAEPSPAPPAAAPPAPVVPLPPLEVALAPAPLPVPVLLPQPPLPQLPVVDGPGKGKGEAKGHERKDRTITLAAASLDPASPGKGPGHGPKGNRA